MAFRFRQLLGDFEDASGGEVLSVAERKQYIEASEKSYVFTVSGEIVHIDKQCTLVKTDYSKEFLDMLMLARSSFIYVCKKERMFTPGFSLNAAKFGGVIFKIIKY